MKISFKVVAATVALFVLPLSAQAHWPGHHHKHHKGCGHGIVVVKPLPRTEVVVVRRRPCCYRPRPGRVLAHAVADYVWYESTH